MGRVTPEPEETIMTPLVTPRLTASGSDPITLVEARLDVVRRARDLLKAMAGAAPNPQDYTPWGGAAPLQATQAWEERTALVEELANEVELDAMKIALLVAGGK